MIGEVRELQPRDPGRFSMYVCGPTVNDMPHIGHGRFALVWDVLRRWLTYGGLDVRYVSNITDVDDKIIERARRDGRSVDDVVAQYEGEWWWAMDALGVARPTVAPHATQYVDRMVELVSDLVDHGIAYVIDDGVYLDVSRVPDYGCLSGQPLDALRATERVEPNEQKRSPLDFAVWKAAKPGEPSWPAGFGAGRPGWHTECVVMSLDLLGDGFDLHTGGLDLKFPHHENERAQAVALGSAFSRRWSHNGWVMVGDQKMSNSLGNFTTLRELLGSNDQRAYRLLVLRSHYRSPIDVSPESLSDAARALSRLDTFARRFQLPALAVTSLVSAAPGPGDGPGALLHETVSERLDDDLDTPGAVALLFGAVAEANALADRENNNAQELAAVVNTLFGAMGLSLRSDVAELDATSTAIIAERDAARTNGDWARADALRDQLVSMGWTVEDTPRGTAVRR
jgi:cysteinyl-tRNA synthetase